LIEFLLPEGLAASGGQSENALRMVPPNRHKRRLGSTMAGGSFLRPANLLEGKHLQRAGFGWKWNSLCFY
jgi:hypothetical protein